MIKGDLHATANDISTGQKQYSELLLLVELVTGIKH